MRLAFLTPEYVTEKSFDGGLANYLNRVAHALVDRGHDVEVITVSDRNEVLDHDGVAVHRVQPQSKWFFRLHRFFGNDIPVTKGMVLESYCLRRRFLERQASAPFDVVQAASFRAPGLALSISSPVPVVTRASSHRRMWDEAYGYNRTRDYKLRAWLEMQALKRSTRVYAPSSFLAETLTKELGTRVDVLRPPFFVEEKRLSSEAYEESLQGLDYLLFIGTIGRLKGAFVLAEALVELMPKFPDMHVALAGKDARDDTGSSSLDAFKRGLEPFLDRIHYLGAVPHAELYVVLQNARVVVLPSLVDNLPNACMEAMGFGCVVVASDGVSFDELITDGESGFLTEVGDPHALAQKVAVAWNVSDSHRTSIGERAKASVAALKPEATVARLEEYFEAVVEESSRHRYCSRAAL